MLKRFEVYFIASIFILITGVILIIYTMEREQEFKSHSSNIQQTVVHGVAYAINLQLQNKRRHVNLFLEEYAKLFLHIDRYPDDEITSNNISRRLQQRFTDFFTYTITDKNGAPTLLDIDALVGDACQIDLENFANRVKRDEVKLNNEVFIHPQSFHYHYDIMAPLPTNVSNSRIFFASFYLNEIADILKTHEIPGQQLFLIRQSEPSLIEVSRQGARDKLKRDIKLTHDEQISILVYEDIPGTDWRVVNLPDANYEKQYINGLWKEVIVILTTITIALIILISLMFKLSGRNTAD